jgi:hypothetical protein
MIPGYRSGGWADGEWGTMRPAMSDFSSVREAKEYLIGRIVDEAQRENVPLSEIERKMLYFTESGWTLPDIIEVAEKFDEEYEQTEYERKIALLCEHAMGRAREEGQLDRWREAARLLNTEDHYLSVMIGQASATVRPPHDRLKLWATAFALVAVFMCVSLVAAHYNIDLDKYMPSRYALDGFIWIVVVAGFAFFVVGDRLFGPRFSVSIFDFVGRLGAHLGRFRRKLPR